MYDNSPHAAHAAAANTPTWPRRLIAGRVAAACHRCAAATPLTAAAALNIRHDHITVLAAAITLRLHPHNTTQHNTTP
jgi:hypothetical protein